MASAIIHMCVAKKINEKLNLEEKELLLGSIAPDISKLIGETKQKSHFLTTPKKNVPNIHEFLNKYHNIKWTPFNIGYFIHLYTDKLWFDDFIRKLSYDNKIKLKDNTILSTNEEEIGRLIYNDYKSLNTKLLDKYNLDLSLFYEPTTKPITEITEIPTEKLNILLDQMSLLIMDEETSKEFVFDSNDISFFVDYCYEKILKKLIEYNIINYKETSQ